MITCHSVQRIQNLSFSNYLLLPQYSHSYLKHENSGFGQSMTATPKMLLGSLVDDIRTGSNVDMDNKLYPTAKVIATFLKTEFGWALDRLQKQVSYTGIMRLQTGNVIFELPVKGRPDFVEPKSFIIDLKVTHTDNIDETIKFMGYPNQQFGYGKLDGCPLAYLLFYRVKKKDIILKRIPIADTNKFWEEKILKFGKVV